MKQKTIISSLTAIFLLATIAIFFLGIFPAQQASAQCYGDNPIPCNNTTNTCESDCPNSGANCSAGSPTICYTSLVNPHSALCSLLGYLSYILRWVFGIGVFLGIVFLVIGAIRYITAGDDIKQIKDAKGSIMWALAGLVILMTAGAFILLVGRILGFLDPKQLFIINVTKCP